MPQLKSSSSHSIPSAISNISIHSPNPLKDQPHNNDSQDSSYGSLKIAVPSVDSFDVTAIALNSKSTPHTRSTENDSQEDIENVGTNSISRASHLKQQQTPYNKHSSLSKSHPPSSNKHGYPLIHVDTQYDGSMEKVGMDVPIASMGSIDNRVLTTSTLNADSHSPIHHPQMQTNYTTPSKPKPRSFARTGSGESNSDEYAYADEQDGGKELANDLNGEDEEMKLVSCQSTKSHTNATLSKDSGTMPNKTHKLQQESAQSDSHPHSSPPKAPRSTSKTQAGSSYKTANQKPKPSEYFIGR